MVKMTLTTKSTLMRLSLVQKTRMTKKMRKKRKLPVSDEDFALLLLFAHDLITFIIVLQSPRRLENKSAFPYIFSNLKLKERKAKP